MNPILKIHEKDNVGTSLRHLERGEVLDFENCTLVAKEEIPQYHKIALTDIPIHSPIFKYGQVIGIATQGISQGAYVHVHNIESTRGRGDKKEEC